MIWNLLIFIDGTPWRRRGEFGWSPTAALAFWFLTTVALKVSPRVQALALKPGRSFGEVRALVNLFQLIGGVMLFAFGAQLVARLLG